MSFLRRQDGAGGRNGDDEKARFGIFGPRYFPIQWVLLEFFNEGMNLIPRGQEINHFFDRHDVAPMACSIFFNTFRTSNTSR